MNILLCLSLALQSLAWNSEEPDKVLHREVMFVSSSVLYGALRASDVSIGQAAVIAVTTGLLVGHLKESTDSFYDPEDMVANAEGLGVFMLIPIAEWSFR